ncbi:MAG: hypothetical protein N2595_04900, partial [bacterium]|nr:hypothetical protein [bacterium]
DVYKRQAWDSATIVRGGGGMPPAIVSIVPPSGYVSVTSVVGMTITVSDDLGQVVVQVNGQVAGGTYPVYSYQFGLGAEGQWVTAMVVVTDNEGMAATQSVWYTWSRVGNVAPIVHILQPSTDGSVMPTNYIPVFGTAEDIDGTVVRVEVDGEVVNGSYYPWYVPGYGPLQVGTNVIRALAIDNGGATGKAERVVYYEGLAPKDVVPPVVRIVQPENWFEATHSPIVVSGWATDNYAVAAVEVNGTVVAPPGYPGAWEHTLGLQPGTNMIVARATDHAGNAGYATAMVVYVAGVDTNPPSVWITSHYNHEVVYEADQVIAGTSSDGMRGSGVTSVYVNAERAIGVAPFVRPMRLNYGMNVVTAIAIDGAGNTSAPASVIIYYLTNPPMPVAGITISTPSVPETNVAQVVFGGWYGINDLPLSGVITARVNGQVVWSMVTASGPVIAPWNAGLIELAPGTNMLGAELTLQSGFVVTAQRMIVYTFDTNVPSIAIVTPQDGSTVGVRRVGLRGTDALNGGALGRISASVNGEEVGVQVDVPGAGQWDGGEVLLRRGWNEIRARIELSNSNSAEHVIQVYCSSEVPEVVITHPQAATSRYAQVLYFGTFDFRAATNGMVIGWLNGTPVMVYTPAAGITQGTWSAGEVTLQLGLNILSARVVVATGEADDDVVRIVYDPNYEDTSRPRIQIVEPSAVVTNATPVRFYGTYDLGGGILDYLTGYVNNVGCALEINARTTWDGGTKGLVLGMNQFVAIVRLKNGAAATSRWDIVLTYDDPFIQITFPTLEETWVTEANQIHLGGVYLCVTTRLAAITWRNEANGAEGLAVWTNGYWNAHYVPLQACTNNRVVVTLRNAGGYEVRDVITILVPSSNETLEVICNWPRYLGVGQTGLVEFLSVEAEVPYRIYWGPTNNNVVIGSGTVRAGEMIGARYYQVGRYRIDDASLVLNGRGVSNDIWLAVVGATTRVARLPRTTYVVPNMVVNQKAVVNQDIDGDVFTVTYKGEESTVRQVIGRTVVLSNLTGQESLAVKVKQNANGGDGAVVLAMLEIESGVLKGLKWVGDVDDVVVSGSLERIAISGGNLGYCYDGRSRYYHGLVATRNGSSEGRGLKQVTVKAKKVKVNGQSVVVGGNIEGDVRADMSMQGKGVTIAAGNGSVQARIVVDAIKGLVAKGRAPAGMISNSHVIARGEIVGKGISIGKVQTRVLHDTMVVGAGDIKGVAAVEVTDSTRDLQGDVTNHPRRAMQIIAGWRHGGLDAPFRPWLVASNGYGGVIVSGVVHRVSAKSVCEGVGVTEFGEKGIKKPSEKVNQTNFAWWVNGQLAPADWDGKSRP